jgi:DNA invertase Pin-like site-specific DNA recombinase
MKHQTIGYIRVSSQGQNIDRQLQGIELDKKFIDIQTGSVKERKELIACIDYVREGDTLIVDSIDRLARNVRDLQDIIKTFRDKGVSVKFVKENLTFSTKDDPLANLMLQMMGAFAELEYNMIKARQREGIDAAKKLGRLAGRPPMLTEKHKKEAEDLRAKGTSIRRIAKEMSISRMSVYKLLGK